DDNVAIVKELGVDEVIDYKTTDFSEVLHDYDAVFDTVGGDDFNKALHILKSGGIAVSMAGQADEALVSELGVQAISQGTHVTTEALKQLTHLVEAGVVTPHIDKVFAFKDINEAFKSRESGSTKGKIVIQLR
ncbi:MAG: zinc-binding dehydrogenase, partial [Candidatus Saccharimonadales bacterium]